MVMPCHSLLVLLAIAFSSAAADTGKCSTADVASMEKAGPGHSSGAFPKLAADCGSTSWSLVRGFNQEKFGQCLAGSADISSDCASCFAGNGQYGFDNCKVACMVSWCSSACLECTAGYQERLVACAGSEPPAATSCDRPSIAGVALLPSSPPLSTTVAGKCTAVDIASMEKAGPGHSSG
eukprot:CAMPEP_0115219680 /NCGR_PEP_ID=MMETSP0270-20121206/27049_1 /TAXON_ID=71861 /ORGANISM="Scrippsiella trochoidea, Strain CCMP3099" /LENGTH=179 /DNA_ID=CAMNT_0002633697 /DNA_START=52 /DNA_END=588 /DNA_ORIENTATION=-